MTGSASSCLVNKLLVKDRNLRGILFLIKSKYKPANRTFIYIISVILQKDSSYNIIFFVLQKNKRYMKLCIAISSFNKIDANMSRKIFLFL